VYVHLGDPANQVFYLSEPSKNLEQGDS
jgi:hypothetical protein